MQALSTQNGQHAHRNSLIVCTCNTADSGWHQHQMVWCSAARCCKRLGTPVVQLAWGKQVSTATCVIAVNLWLHELKPCTQLLGPAWHILHQAKMHVGSEHLCHHAMMLCCRVAIAPRLSISVVNLCCPLVPELHASHQPHMVFVQHSKSRNQHTARPNCLLVFC